MVIEKLKSIQQRHGYLPADELKSLSEESNIPLYQLHGVASFYPHFKLTPPTSTTLHVCHDLSCHLRKSGEVLKACEAAAKELSDEQLEVHGVSCLGQCDRGPAVAVNDAIFADIDSEKLKAMLSDLQAHRPLKRQRLRQPTGALQIDPYTNGVEPYSAYRRVKDGADPQSVIETLKESQLRGMGGAGFPAGVKWELVRNAADRPPLPHDPEPDIKKYVICNADESEPGTFKDRLILQRASPLVIEGMLIAMEVVGAQKGILYIRHEYSREKEIFAREVRRLKSSLGMRSPSIAIFESPGGYICGEETALLEALEGRRAEPRNKPPFPGTHGLYQKPTLINNVETFAWIPSILHRGAHWWKGFGQNGATGLKFFALSGDVKRPGVYEVPLGITASELITKHGEGVTRGKKLKAFSPGGASSGFLPASMADIALDFRSLAEAGSMLGSGAVVSIAEGACMLDLALNLCRFFRNESCGKCVPCRAGSEKIVDLLSRIQQGKGSENDLRLIDELSETMQLTSICGLGQVAAAPITSAIKHFKDEIFAHVIRRECPARVCSQ